MPWCQFLLALYRLNGGVKSLLYQIRDIVDDLINILWTSY